jgi:hypothetical protein
VGAIAASHTTVELRRFCGDKVQLTRQANASAPRFEKQAPNGSLKIRLRAVFNCFRVPIRPEGCERQRIAEPQFARFPTEREQSFFEFRVVRKRIHEQASGCFEGEGAK